LSFCQPWGGPFGPPFVAIYVILCYYDAENQPMKEITMKHFDYTDMPKKLLTPDIVAMLTNIHEHKGKQSIGNLSSG